jgi:poly(beta-D-mannuronate) lyase
MLNRLAACSPWPLGLILFMAACSSGGAGPRGRGGAGGTDGEGGAGGSPTGGTGGATGGTGGAANGGTGGRDAGSGGAGGNVAEAGAPPGDGGGLPPSNEEPLPPCKRMVPVANAGALGGAISGAAPGDCLIVADGQYGSLTIGAKGTAQAPIVIRAENRLKPSLSGLRMAGASYVVVEGFTFPGGAGATIDGNSSYNRISRSRFSSGTAQLAGSADHNRIDHNEFGPKGSDGNMVRATGLSTNTLIDHNYFHDVSPAGANGRETIVLGCCGAMFDYHDTGDIVEHNLLVNCSGEAEIISVKSSKNIIRYNTVRNSTGNITLRAGRNTAVYGNYVFGTGNQGGIRMFEDNHRIFNNYVATGSALIGNRVDDIHAEVKNAIIVHNTFLGSVALSGQGNVFSDNITGGTTNLGGAMAQGNLTSEAAGLMPMGEVQVLTASSKAVDAATGTYPFLMDDVQGQPRSKPDVGADELSTSPELYRPLTPRDVGPEGGL